MIEGSREAIKSGHSVCLRGFFFLGDFLLSGFEESFFAEIFERSCGLFFVWQSTKRKRN